jgi:hypothetical protein
MALTMGQPASLSVRPRHPGSRRRALCLSRIIRSFESCSFRHRLLCPTSVVSQDWYAYQPGSAKELPTRKPPMVFGIRYAVTWRFAILSLRE